MYLNVLVSSITTKVHKVLRIYYVNCGFFNNNKLTTFEIYTAPSVMK